MPENLDSLQCGENSSLSTDAFLFQKIKTLEIRANSPLFHVSIFLHYSKLKNIFISTFIIADLADLLYLLNFLLMFISSFGQISVLWVLKYFGLPLITHWKIYTGQKNNHKFLLFTASCQQPLPQSREEQQSVVQPWRCLPVCQFPWR